MAILDINIDALVKHSTKLDKMGRWITSYFYFAAVDYWIDI
jgi:hypothetical protein